MANTYLALLRGINVGGNNKLPMKDLVEMFVAAGASDVRAYIQSGNVIFRANVGLAERVPGLIAVRIDKRWGYRTPVVLRTTEDLRGAVRNNPFLQAGAQEETLHVMFLAAQPEPGAVAGLDPDRSPPDAFAVRGREVYLRLPNGARSKLTNAYFDSKLGTISTVRNWRTVNKLLEMMEE